MSTVAKLLVVGAIAIIVTIGLYRASRNSGNADSMSLTGAASASKVRHLTDASDHKAEVEDSTIPVLLDFHATWCPPCQMLSPHIEEVAKQYKGKVKVLKVDVDQAKKLAAKYGVNRMPTLIIVLPGGKGQIKEIGYKDLSELKNWIDKSIK